MTRVSIRGLGSIGIVSDAYEQDVPPQAFSACRNVRFGDRGAQSFLGETEVFDASDAASPIALPTWVKFFPDRSYPRWLYADNNRVFCYENFVHTNITRYTAVVGDNNYNATDRWQGALFNGIGILNNGFDAPQQWNPVDDSQRLANLANWIVNYRCRFIKPFKNFLISGYIYDGATFLPYRIHWSHPAVPGAVPSSWVIGTPGIDAGEFEVTETPDHLVDGLQMGDQFIVYRESTTWAMQLTGTSQIFRLYPLSQSAGVLWKDCVSEIQKGHVVASWDDLYIHQGSKPSFQSLLDRRTRKYLSSIRDTENYKNSFNVINEPEKEIWHCFPETGHVLASKALVWNWVDGQVGFRELNSVPFADAGPVLLTP